VLSARVSAAISDAEYLGLEKYLIGFLRAALIPPNLCKIFSTVPLMIVTTLPRAVIPFGTNVW
jgi:hypothetical protein